MLIASIPVERFASPPLRVGVALEASSSSTVALKSRPKAESPWIMNAATSDRADAQEHAVAVIWRIYDQSAF
jgi:hypothetical protein